MENPTKAKVTRRGQQKKSGLLEVISFCKELNLDAERVGQWVWVTFAQKPCKATRKALKDMGFRWSKRRGKWAHNCGRPTKSSNGDPWEKYEHYKVHSPRRN